jgi:hypothetical protein
MKGAMRKAAIIAIIVGVLLIIGFIVAGIFGVLLDVLYIFLIILAAFTLISTIYLIYAVFLLVQTITTVRNEMQPLLVSVQRTAGIVQDTARTAGQTVTTIGSTAQLTSEFAVGPTIRAAATVMAGQEVLRVFLGKGRTRSRAEERRRKQMEAIAKGVE